MERMFLTVLRMSAAGAAALLAVILARLLLKRAPKWMALALWGLSALRLALPLFIASPVSLQPRAVQRLFETAYTASRPVEEKIPEETGKTTAPSGMGETVWASDNTAPAATAPANTAPAATAPANTAPANTAPANTAPAATEHSSAAPVHIPASTEDGGGPSALKIASVIWLAGALVMAGYLFACHFALKRRLADAVRADGNVYESERVQTPFLLGIFAPRIYMPFGLTEKQRGFVLAHERAHIAGLDHIWKPLGFLLLAVHWFDPVVWAGYALFCRDIEMNCDERVLRRLGPGSAADYTEALVELSAGKGRTAVGHPAFGETDIKERVSNMKSMKLYKKPALWMILAFVLTAAALTGCFMTSPMSGAGPDGEEDLISMLEKGYSFDDAVKAGLPAAEEGEAFVSGEDAWLDFMDSMNAGVTCSVRLFIRNGEEFSVNDLSFDGQSVTRLLYSKDGDGWICTEERFGELERTRDPVAGEFFTFFRLVGENGKTELLKLRHRGTERSWADLGGTFYDIDCDGVKELICLSSTVTGVGYIALDTYRGDELIATAWLIIDGRKAVFGMKDGRLCLKCGDELIPIGLEKGKYVFGENSRIEYVSQMVAPEEPPADAISMKNPILERRVRELMRLPDNYPITPGLLAGLSGISVWAEELGDISELELMTGLEYLDIANAADVDTDVIARLTGLTQLTLNNCGLKDISFVSGLKKLKAVFMNNNLVSDLAPLAELPELRALYIENNLVSDPTPLFKVEKLSCVCLSGNPLNEAGIDALAEYVREHHDPEYGDGEVRFETEPARPRLSEMEHWELMDALRGLCPDMSEEDLEKAAGWVGLLEEDIDMQYPSDVCFDKAHWIFTRVQEAVREYYGLFRELNLALRGT